MLTLDFHFDKRRRANITSTYLSTRNIPIPVVFLLKLRHPEPEIVGRNFEKTIVTLVIIHHVLYLPVHTDVATFVEKI